jgi:hypothetical protein
MTLRTDLNRLLSDLEVRTAGAPVGELPRGSRAEAWFCLALAYRRRATKPIERISARIEWARMALRMFDLVDSGEGREPGGVPAPSPRRRVRRP